MVRVNAALFALPRIRVHGSFFTLFLMLFAFLVLEQRDSVALGLFAVSSVLLVASLIAHEWGHAVAARAHGVEVADIVLHPLGAMARLAYAPKTGAAEASIAAAGPLMNLLLGALSLLLLRLGPTSSWADWLAHPMIRVNFALGALNLFPAFPMDGGRILRGALTGRLGRLRATEIAVRVGRWAISAVLIAELIGHPFGLGFGGLVALGLAALVIFVLGEVERQKVRLEASGPGGPGSPFIFRFGFPRRDRQADPGAAEEPAPSRPPAHGVIDVDGTSRVVEDRGD